MATTQDITWNDWVDIAPLTKTDDDDIDTTWNRDEPLDTEEALDTAELVFENKVDVPAVGLDRDEVDTDDDDDRDEDDDDDDGDEDDDDDDVGGGINWDTWITSINTAWSSVV